MSAGTAGVLTVQSGCTTALDGFSSRDRLATMRRRAVGAVEVGDVARDAVEASFVSFDAGIYGVPRRGATVLTPSGCC